MQTQYPILIFLFFLNTQTPATTTKTPGKSTEDKLYVIVWNEEKQTLYTNTDTAVKKASESGSSMRMFTKKGEALKFVDTLKGNQNQVITPGVTEKNAKHGANTEDKVGESKMSAKDLTEMFNRGIINSSGNKVIVNYINITNKNTIVVVVDVCRETTSADGATVRRVSTNKLYVLFYS